MPLDSEDLKAAASHLLAAAVHELFPTASLIDSHVHAQGFFSDFVFPFVLQQEQLSLIEERMRKIVKEKRRFEFKEMVPKSSAALLQHQGRGERAKLLQGINEALVTLVQLGNFIDFSFSDPHAIKESGEVAAFRLFPEGSSSSSRPGVTRLHGVAFPDRESLKAFLKKRDVALKNHLELGKELQLFSYASSGDLVWHPKGEELRQRMEQFWRAHLLAQNFHFLTTSIPKIASDLTDAHANYFLEFKAAHRLAECARFSLDDPSILEEGLLDASCQTIDRAHLFCQEDQLKEISISSLQSIVKILKILRFKFELVLCSSGKSLSHKRKESVLQEALHACKEKWSVHKAASFCANPRIEARVADALGRKWAISFIEVSSCQSEESEDGQPFLVWSLYGSFERFIALLLEAHQGVLPIGLASEQLRVISVSKKTKAYAEEVVSLLKAQGYRATLDCREGEELKRRLHEALRDKTPILALVGEREENEKQVTVRDYLSQDGVMMTIEKLVEKLKQESGIEN